MNKSLIKFLSDFGPLLIVFVVYYKSGKNLVVAIPPLILATLIAVIVIYIVEKKIPYIPLIGAFLISLFGGLTIFFKNPIFIYLKPTVINIIFAISLLVGKVFLNKNLLKIFFKNSLSLEEEGWNKLVYRWIAFFVLLAVLNEIMENTN